MIVELSEILSIEMRKPTSPADKSCAFGVHFGNALVAIETCLCSVGFSYYELPDANLRKADLYVIQRPYKIEVDDNVNKMTRTSVAFIGVRAPTAHELYVALLDLTRNKHTLAQYTERVNVLMTAEREWQEKRVVAAQNAKTSTDDDDDEPKK